MIKVGVFQSSHDVPFHLHDEAEFVYVVEGNCKIKVDNSVLEGQAGTIFHLPEAKQHNQINQGLVKTIYWRSATFNLKKRSAYTLHFIDNTMERQLLAEWAQQLWQAFGAQKTNTLLQKLADTIYCLINEVQSNANKYAPSLQRAIDYIHVHFHDTISNQTLSKQAHLSESHLMALFKKEVGLSPQQYITEMKMKQAKGLLADPYLSVKEIGYACGFEDINYFQRVFKKSQGLSPGQWRKNNDS